MSKAIYRGLKCARKRAVAVAAAAAACCLVPSVAGGVVQESRGLRIIVVQSEAEANDLGKRIREGSSFDTLARQHSADASSADGGYIGSVSPSGLRQDYRDALNGLGPGEVSPVIRDGRDFVLLQWLTPDEERWVDRNSAAAAALREGRFAEAERLLVDAIGAAEKLPHEDQRLAESLHGLAQLYLQQGRFPEARKLYMRSLPIFEAVMGKRHPNVAYILNNIGETYRLEGANSEAEPLYLRSLEILEEVYGKTHRNLVTILNNLGVVRHLQGKSAEAKPLFERSVAIIERELGVDHPSLATHLVNLAAVDVDEGEYDQARALLERSLRIEETALGPDNPDVLTIVRSLADVAVAQERYDEAESLYHRLLSIYWGASRPEEEVEHVLESFASVINLSRFGGEALEAAIREFEQALEAAPPSEPVYVFLSDALEDVELSEPAEAVILQAIRAFPESRFIRFDQGRLYTRMGRWRQALEVMELASRMDSPSSPSVDSLQRSQIYRYIGTANVHLGQSDEAVTSLERASEIAPGNPEALVDLANALLDRGMVEEAWTRYSEAVAAAPDNAEAHYGLARVSLSRGQFAEAAAHAATALANDSQHRKARYLRGMALIRSGKKEEGQKEIETFRQLEADAKATENTEREVSATIWLAASRLKEDPDATIALFRDAIKKHPDAGLLYLNMGVAQSRLGRHKAALDTFLSMLDQGLGSPFLVHLNLSREYKALGDARAEARHRVLHLQSYEEVLSR